MAQKRTKTTPGVGGSDEAPRPQIDGASADSDVPAFPPEAPTATRKRASRPAPVTVDDVGPTAVRLARAGRRPSAPKLLVSRSIIAQAPIDHRAAFLLSMIDGKNDVDALIDMSGMDTAEVHGLLERLARLGLVELP